MIPRALTEESAGAGLVVSVIGMSRSGTTFLCKLLATIDPGIAIDMEPNMIWKAGSFRYLSDEEYRVRPRAVAWIRNKLTSVAPADHILVEKTPPNVFRPHLVHAVLPGAKIVYIEREDFRCIASNLRRTLKHEALNPEIVFRKYVRPAPRWRETNLTGFEQSLDAVGGRSIFRQLRTADFPQFLRYAIRMYVRRLTRRPLPFGPKITDFDQILRTEGPIVYYIRCLERAKRHKADFVRLFGGRFAEFQLAKLQTDPAEVARLSRFCGVQCSENRASSILSGLDRAFLDQFRPVDELERKVQEVIERTGRRWPEKVPVPSAEPPP